MEDSALLGDIQTKLGPGKTYQPADQSIFSFYSLQKVKMTYMMLCL